MFAILYALGMFVADLFKSRCRLEAENLLLRHQLTIALRQAPPRLRLRGGDRALLIWMTRLWQGQPSSVVSRPLEGEAPTIDLVVGFHKSNTSTILRMFLSRINDLTTASRERVTRLRSTLRR